MFSLSIAFVKRNDLDFNAANCLGNATPVTAEILSKLS